MTHRPSPRRSFLGGLLSGAAALGALGTGALSALVTACSPPVKYGGPPPVERTKYGGPPPVDVDPAPPEDGGAEPAVVDAGETEAADGGPFAQPPPEASGTGDDLPPPVPKYGGPPPDRPTTKYGGPPMNVPKYGGPSTQLPKYGGPAKT